MQDLNSVVSPEYRELEQEQARIVFEVLEEWFKALEDGSASNRFPDHRFVSPVDRPEITEELVGQLIAGLDREMEIDAFDRQGKKFGATAATEFCRLDYPQRLALTQRLIEILLSKEQMEEIATSLRMQRNAQAQ